MSIATFSVGVDVSKDSFDYYFQPSGLRGKLPNSASGANKFISKMSPDKPDIVVLEATGGYQDALTEALFSAGINLKVANPKHIRDFARSLGKLGKTDAVDAKIIADFGLSREIIPDQPKDPLLVQISALLTRRDQLNAMITMERGHQEHTGAEITAQIKQNIAYFQGQLYQLDRQIQSLINSRAEMKRMDEIIQSIPGVGPVASATILAELPELMSIGRKQAAALVGVAPFNRDSGQYRGQRHICGGRGKVRDVLYCVMRPCLIHNPVVKEWFEQFRGRGKAYKVAVIACVRKLLLVIRAMLISNTQWAPQRSVPTA